jgi:hypothetical protein
MPLRHIISSINKISYRAPAQPENAAGYLLRITAVRPSGAFCYYCPYRKTAVHYQLNGCIISLVRKSASSKKSMAEHSAGEKTVAVSAVHGRFSPPASG